MTFPEAPIDIIQDFITRYVKEYDFYDTAARLVKEALESGLQAAGVRCIVTHRPKSIARLEAKCRQRLPEKKYEKVDDIFNDIVDLAGVRVALYFPAEQGEVDKLVTNLFVQLEPKKEFPKKDAERPGKRFSGYSAVHYRVQLKENHLPEPDKRYALARVEIQVASVLMHAWSEVEHDLVYKPIGGDLSEDENALLDQLNGLVHSGEIALERLQKAGERRIDETQRKFRNHFELAAYLLGQLRKTIDGPVSDSGLGRVDNLFEFLVRIGIDTPELLNPSLDSLHGNVEVRSLAEQVVDALLVQDQSRYEVYRVIQSENRRSAVEDDESEMHLLVGQFISTWGELEHIVRRYIWPLDMKGKRTKPLIMLLQEPIIGGLLDEEMLFKINQLRLVRNEIVHNQTNYDFQPGILQESVIQLKSVVAELRRRYNPGNASELPDL
ncbi:RelA/SpoT domain-containing protein [Nocardia sp. NPDC005366]|uniref:GTP pyrophosphokinase n=1 Tax=Nocardia sp. NPDC005366 TaxID=3156878 RepID=UPI0033B049B2